MIEAWASLKSFRPKNGNDRHPPCDGSRNPGIDFKGQIRKNDTHRSTTDPESRLFKKSKGKEAKLCYMGHVLMENRSGLVVDCRLTQANGTSERQAALEMIESLPGTGRITVGADKGYDAASFVHDLRQYTATPHVAQKSKSSAVDRRTTRHEGYRTSQILRKRVEEIFGWAKTIGMLRKTRHRGVQTSQMGLHPNHGSVQSGTNAKPDHRNIRQGPTKWALSGRSHYKTPPINGGKSKNTTKSD